MPETKVLETLELLYRQGIIDALDLEFGRLMGGLARDHSRELLLGCAMVSRAVSAGDACLSLGEHAGQLLLRAADEHEAVVLPALPGWREVLRSTGVVGEPGEFRPLILDAEDRLYIYRYWHYENELAVDVLRRANTSPVADEARLASGLRRLFPPQQGRADWQRVAAAVAVLRGLSVISGGPGTGKTTTLARVLALLIEQTEVPPRIFLAAPTGKAAARMQEAIRASKVGLVEKVDPGVLAAIPEQASTLHRLLGLKPDGVYFRHDRDNPLSLDVLVIDEASMVDLALMAKTLWALSPGARLVLLGDKDQLSSVEAGAVLGELCAGNGRYSLEFAAKLSHLTGEQVPGNATGRHSLGDNVALLSYSYRFGGDSGIGRLAALVNQQNLAGLKALFDESLDDVCWRAMPTSRAVDVLLERMLTGYGAYLEAVGRRASMQDILTAFGGFRVLCAQRSGELGVENLNRRFESLLKTRARHSGGEWYVGRAILVVRNDYQLQLFNGDVGITLPDPGNPERLRVFFQVGDGVPRSVAVTRLPEYEPVFAMTVHKSQGSEFDRVLLVSPMEETPVMSRELVYTAVTRAKIGLEIWGSQDSLLRAVRKPVQRASGLGAKLAGNGNARAAGTPGSGIV